MIIHSNSNNNLSLSDFSSFKTMKKVSLDDLANLFAFWSKDNIFKQSNENFILNLSGFNFFESFVTFTKKITQKFFYNEKVYNLLNNHPKLNEFISSLIQEVSPAYFDINLKETFIHKKALFDGGNFTDYLINVGKLSQGEIAMLVLFHELGHAVHVKYAIQNHKSFANFLEPHEQFKKEIIDNVNSLYPSWNECSDDALAHSIEESFSDNYSLLMIFYTLGKKRAIEIGQIVLKARINMAIPEGYLYHNQWGIEKLINNFESMKEPLEDNFKNFNSFYTYLSKIVFYNFTQQLSHYYNSTDAFFDEKNIKLLSRHYLLLKTNTYPLTLHNDMLINQVQTIQNQHPIFTYLPNYKFSNLISLISQLKIIDPSIVINNKTKLFNVEPYVYEYAKDNINLEFNNINKLYYDASHLTQKIQQSRTKNFHQQYLSKLKP